MECGRCGHENPEGNRFCGGCGAPLARSCPACGRENPEDHRFCGGCGAALEAPPDPAPREYTPRHLQEKILSSKAALEGERKRVTVLFADTRRSTELASAVDPEDWHRILDRFFALLLDGVHRFEGTVNQFTGDGIMALFGAPVAHEDHAQRACWAALSLRDELRAFAREVKREHGIDFQVRLGLNSGDVVVGKIGDDLRMDYTAQGPTVHLAARMEDLAEPGRVYLAPGTAEVVEPYFALEDLGEFRVKGVGAVRVHELAGAGAARTRFDVSRARGLSRFVGRDREMQTLEAALEQAQAGNGQVVGIVADAGTGKSRLSYEFVQGLRARGLRVYEGSGVAHGKNLPFLPILQVLRGYFGITEQDDDRSARDKIAGRMLLLDEGYREAVPLIFEFLGVPDPDRPAPPLPPEARQRKLFGVLRQNLQAGPEGASQSAGVVLVEDLHWIDEGSDAWISEWVESTAGSHNLLVVNFRPEYHAPWMQRAHYQQIALAPLSPEAIRELLVSLLGSDASLEGLPDRIHELTAGNPFFAEEVVQTLIESGQLEGGAGAYRLATPIDRLQVPPSVQAVLSARIDRLPEREKRVLQMASVIGKDFEEPLLREVAELPEAELADALATLRAAEFVHEHALYPVAEYTFKHPLTQSVALDSLLRDRRRDLHGRVARALEARSTDLGEDAPLLAHHYEEAGEAQTASSWHLRAADWIGAQDVAAAAHHARSVLTLLGGLEDPEAAGLLASAAGRLLQLGWRIGIQSEAEQLYTDGRRWAKRAGDLTAEANVCASYAAVLAVGGREEESIVVGDEFQALAREIGDPELVRLSRAWMAYPHVRLGRFAKAEALIEAGVEEGERNPEFGRAFLGASLTGLVLQWLCEIHPMTRPWPEAHATRDRTLRWARERNEVENECYTIYTVARFVELAGEVESSLPLLRHGLALAEDLGAPLPRLNARWSLAVGLIAQGEAERALELATGALEESRERRVGLEMEGDYVATLAMARLGAGERDEALVRAEESVQIAERTPFSLPWTLHALARIRMARGELDEAGAALDRLERIVDEIGARNYVPVAAWRRAELAEKRGDSAECERLLREAHAGFVERGAEGHAATIAQLL